jgi:hypothetical protein
MAKYWEDWSGYDVGDDPTVDGPAGWTKRWRTSNVTYTIESDDDGPAGKRMRADLGTINRRAISMNAVDTDANRVDAKIRALVRVNGDFISNAYTATGVIARSGGATSSENAQGAMLIHRSGSGADKYIVNNGGYLNGTVTNDSSDVTSAWARNTLCWVGLDLDGDNATAYVWDVSDTETPIASISTTSTSVTDTGRIGVFFVSQSFDVDVLAFAVATGDDDAFFEDPFAETPVAFTGTVPTQTYTVDEAITPLDLSGFFSGTETPFTYSVQSGTLPTGLSLNTSTGVISGTPTVVAEPTSIVVRATDDATNTADTNSFEITATVMVVKGVRVRLYDNADAAAANITGIQCAWFDQPEPKDFLAPEFVTAVASTDASGWLELDLDSATALAVGAAGFLVAYKLDATDAQDSPVFAGSLLIEDIA